MKITPELVKDFYAAACKEFNANIVDKQDSTLMDLVSKFLDGLGVVDKKEFMSNFTTAIFRNIYVPYTPGVPDDNGYSLYAQLQTAIHELVHVSQYNAEPVKFPVFYLCSKSDRMEYESEAYAADLEFHWFLSKRGYDYKARAKALLSYGLQQEHVDFMAKYLEVQNDVFAQGGEISPVVKWAKTWLTAYTA